MTEDIDKAIREMVKAAKDEGIHSGALKMAMMHKFDEIVEEIYNEV